MKTYATGSDLLLILLSVLWLRRKPQDQKQGEERKLVTKAVLRLLSAWQTSEWKSNCSSASGEISPITLSAYHSEEEHLRLKCEKSFVKRESTKKGDECHLDSDGDETTSDDVWVAEDYSLVPSEEDEAERWDVLDEQGDEFEQGMDSKLIAANRIARQREP